MASATKPSPLLLPSPVSVFGFEPATAPSPASQEDRASCGLQRAFSALSSQLSALNNNNIFSGAAEELTEEEEDEDEELELECTCGMGHDVPAALHEARCGNPQQGKGPTTCATPHQGPASSPVAIPNTSYYKSPAQREERVRLLHHRQVYRAQLEAQEQASRNAQLEETKKLERKLRFQATAPPPLSGLPA